MPSTLTRTASSWIAPNFLSNSIRCLQAFPATLKITAYSAHISGDLATVVHTDDEQENYHGQMLTARYLTTETWHREAGEWKLVLAHIYAELKDPPAITLPAQELQQYAGRYVGGPDLVYLIQWDGKQLVGGRQGRPMKPLEVEVRDVLFTPGQPRIAKNLSARCQRQDHGISWIGEKAGTSSGAAKVPVLRRKSRPR